MSWSNTVRNAFVALAALAAVALVMVSRDAASGLQAVRERGELIVAIRQGPATYYHNAFGPGGFEYDLAAAFAGELGVRLNVVPVASHDEALDLLARGEVDIAAGEALDDGLEARGYALSIPVQSITQLLVCSRDEGSPVSARQSILSGKPLLVSSGSHHVAQLDRLKHHLPALNFQPIENAGEDSLLGLVHEEQAGCAVMDANAWEFHRHLYHDLMVTAELPEPTYFG